MTWLFLLLLAPPVEVVPLPREIPDQHRKFVVNVKVVNQPARVKRADVDRGNPIAPVGNGVDKTVNYHRKHGRKFPKWHKHNNDYYYVGWNHRHWTYWKFYRDYGCYLYWCPHARKYYYWCAPDYCYYPITYIPYGRWNVATNMEEEDPRGDFREGKGGGPGKPPQPPLAADIKKR